MILAQLIRATAAAGASYAAAWLMLTDAGVESQIALYGITVYLAVCLFALLTKQAGEPGAGLWG